MALNPASARKFLKNSDLKALFIEELGWNIHRGASVPVAIESTSFVLVPVAEKHGVQVFECTQPTIPDRLTRQKIDRQLTKTAHEHLLVFLSPDRTEQLWQWVAREPGRPAALREQRYIKGRTGEALIQKLDHLTIAIGDEEQISITGVVQKLKDAFDKDKVTKKFYERFKAEHANFLKLIDGIADGPDREWYASLMLNRLMFVYFVQKKGFLDNDTNYLRNRLARLQASRKDRFHSFYRHFLMRLFHEGLGHQPPRTSELDELLGTVPYLNGGLFDVHELETENTTIQIPDRAFEGLFDFFDAYEWHLDERPLEKGNEINPDVLGYIFEKYINQKQMGAYYTKEDITEYISKSTVIPYLFDAAEKDCAIAFRPEGSLWALLRNDPDRYIFAAVLKGVDTPLPDEIAAGIEDVAKRAGWNRPAAPDFALPTETWREHVARRQRCLELRSKLRAGEVTSINDLITYNLDIRQFAQHVIEQAEGPELLRAFFKAIREITVLDPAVGSGAFLFAALNILEPLYDACLDRMQAFIDDAPKGRAEQLEHFADFREILRQIARHSNREYFVLKSIVINNLYGVDIMEEAVEICKLRLFLKLVAQLERADEIEPLPDMDFNIRAGNALVGFRSLDAVRNAMAVLPNGQRRMTSAAEETALSNIERDAALADEAFQAFHQSQTAERGDSKVIAVGKAAVRDWLRDLRRALDHYLASDHGINPERTDHLVAWQTSHQPFHWFVEFYSIMRDGGFAVVIGNPPYIEVSTIDSYALKGYDTESCGNLFANIWERSIQLSSVHARLGFIIPVASVCTDRYADLQSLWHSAGVIHASNFNDRPSRLFEGLEHSRLSVVLLAKGATGRSYATSYNKWHQSERPTLFQRLMFVDASAFNISGALAKVGSPIELRILEKYRAIPDAIGRVARANGTHRIYYTRKLSYFVQILDFVPEMKDGSGNPREPSELKHVGFDDSVERDVFLAVLNSTLFYWLITVFSDCRNLNRREIEAARYDLKSANGSGQLSLLAQNLMDDIRRNSKTLTLNFKKWGAMQVQATYPRFSKPIIDAIDEALGPHFGFTEEELDFIINYDVKYRMGADEDDEA